MAGDEAVGREFPRVVGSGHRQGAVLEGRLGVGPLVGALEAQPDVVGLEILRCHRPIQGRQGLQPRLLAGREQEKPRHRRDPLPDHVATPLPALGKG